MGSLTGVDILVLLLVGGGAVLGTLRGFVTEVLSLFAWVAVVAALKALQSPVTRVLEPHVGTLSGAAVLAFLLIVLGGGFGALKALIGATLVFLGFSLVYDYWYGASADRPPALQNARTFPLLNATGRALVSFVHAHRAAEGTSEPGAASNTAS